MQDEHRTRAHGYAAFPKDRDLTVSDGTRIAYTVRGDDGGLPVVFVNGWTCTDGYWASIGPALVEAGHRTVFLDLRGHGESGLPRQAGFAARGLRPEDLAPERLAADVLEVLDHAGVEHAVLAGHSIGVEVIVETCRLAPHRVAALIPVAGTYENPVKTFADLSILDRLFPFGDAILPFLPLEELRPVLRRIAVPGVARRFIQATGIGGPNVRDEDIASHMSHIGELNFSVLLKMLSGLRHHRTEEFLSEIDVPALILAGRRDWFTPPSVQERMAALIPGSEILWFEEAGHLLPVEAAAEIPAAIVDFLSRRVVGARPRSPRNVPAG